MSLGLTDLPAVLTPQHLDLIAQLLPQTICGIDDVMKRAGETILALEKLPNYSLLLLQLLESETLPTPLRQLCVINLRNVVSKYWRPKVNLRDPQSQSIGISNEEKAIIRSKLLTHVDEKNVTIVNQIAVLVAQIARLDWPRFWPELIPTIMKVIQENTGVIRQHALHILYRICYAIVARSPGTNNKSFQSLTESTFDYLASLWQQANDGVLTVLSEFAQGRATMAQVSSMVVQAETAKFLVKTLGVMIHYGFYQWGKNNNAVAFVNMVLDRYKVTISALNSLKENPLTKYLGKYIRYYGKFLIKALEHDPDSFVVVLTPALDLCMAAITDHALNREHERFVINCLNLIRKALEVQEYKESGKLGEQIITQYFTTERQQNLLQVLVLRYFAMTPADLDEWEQSPEVFLQDEAVSSIDVRQRPCAFALYSILLRRFTHLAPFLRLALQDMIVSTPTDLQSLLVKDACYSAIAGAPYELHDEIDFSAWYENQLSKEVQIAEPMFRILRRRIAQLIGQWVLKIKDELRPSIYQTLTVLLRENDLVVNVTAAEALEFLINDMNFRVEVFLPYLPEIAAALFRLIRTAQMHDTQMRLMNVIGSMIEMIGEQVRPYTNTILELASEFWRTTTNQDIMRAAVLRLLTKLVQALGDCTEFYSMLLPVINYSTTIENKEELYLLEDGLLLWLVVARNATTFSHDLLALFPNLLKVMHKTYNHHLICMNIIESYIVLGQTEFLSMYATSLGALFTELVGNLKDRGTIALVTPIELLLIMFPVEMAAPLDPVFQKMLSVIFSGTQSDLAVANLLVLFGRFLLHNQNAFFDFFHRMTTSPQNISQQNLLLLLIDIWLSKIDAMSDLRKRKLAAMALSTLLTNIDFVSNFMDTAALILSAAIGVSVDERAGDGPQYRVRPDPEDYIDVSIPELSRLSSQSKQLAILHANDPVKRILLRDCLLSKLQELSQQAPALCENLVKRVDPIVFNQLNAPLPPE